MAIPAHDGTALPPRGPRGIVALLALGVESIRQRQKFFLRLGRIAVAGCTGLSLVLPTAVIAILIVIVVTVEALDLV